MNWGDFTIGFMAGAGVLAMLLAVVAGIYASLAVHLDRSVRQNKPFMVWAIMRHMA